MTAVIPARNEAAVLPTSLPTLLGQDYPGDLAVVLVDDESTDGTAGVAAELGRAAGWTVRLAAGAVPAGVPGPGLAAPGQADLPGAVAGELPGSRRGLRIVGGQPLPGWAGKVWAMSQGVTAAGDTDYLLFTDADIAYGAGTVDRAGPGGGGRTARPGVADGAAARRHRAGSGCWCPRSCTSSPSSTRSAGSTAGRPRPRPPRAAACWCAGTSWPRRAAWPQIRDARIDDVALGRLLKRGRGPHLAGADHRVTSTRPYDQLAELWNMVARSAYTQLRYSPAAVLGTVLGLAWLYLLPPAAAIAGLAGAAAGGGATAWWLAAAGLAGWALMTVSYLPMLRLYRLSPLRAPACR